MELDERESALLAMAAAQADVVAALEADVAERGIMVPGARGGMVVNPAVIEARQGRTALSRLLAGIDLPDSESFVALRASRAARARWNGQEAP
jgi:hypothetical protein